MDNATNINFRCRSRLRDRVFQFADQYGCPASTILRQALQIGLRHFEAEGFRLIREDEPSAEHEAR